MSGRRIESGKLDRRAELFYKTVTQDEFGDPVKTYVSKGFTRVAFRPLKGKEVAQFGREEAAQLIAEFQMRYKADLSVTDFIRFNGYNWSIISIMPWGMKNRDMLNVTAEVLEFNKVVELT
jgi:SPP1 family predicted phage head-tail adaptor